MGANRKIVMYGLLVVLGLIDVVLNIWVYLLERETRPLLFAGVGVLIMIAGIVNIRRERARQN